MINLLKSWRNKDSACKLCKFFCIFCPTFIKNPLGIIHDNLEVIIRVSSTFFFHLNFLIMFKLEQEFYRNYQIRLYTRYNSIKHTWGTRQHYLKINLNRKRNTWLRISFKKEAIEKLERGCQEKLHLMCKA